MDAKIESIIYKVLERRATATEQEALAAWISIGPENEAEFESFKILWEGELEQGSAFDASEHEVNRAKLMGRIRGLESRKRRIVRFRTAISIVLFVATLLISLWNLFSEVANRAVTTRFENASITTVAEFLTENWDVKLSFDSRLKDCRFNGYMVVGSSDKSTLMSLLTALNLDYKIEPSGHFLISGNCGN